MRAPKLSRRQFLAGAGAAALGFTVCRNAQAGRERPNFVFILIDDLRYDALGCLGHPVFRTPNIDRLASEGARFANAFVTTSLCSPSRASFLTGRYAHSHGVINNSTPFPDELPTFPLLLQKSGYETAYIGKWHMGTQEGVRPGFDRWVSFKGQGVYRNPKLNVDGKQTEAVGYTTDLLTDYALDFISKPRSKPFCLYLSHKAVHTPYKPATRHLSLYKDAVPKRPANSGVGENEPAWFPDRRGEGHGWNLDTEYEEKVRLYGRVLAAADDSVGRVLAALERAGTLNNTVVVFCGDNGYMLGEHGLADKRTMHEESIRIPMLARYPKLIKPGTVVGGTVLNIDVCPTFLELAGVRPPDGVQGVSFVPLVRGCELSGEREWLYEYFQEKGFKATPTIHCVRTRKWKYAEFPETTDKPVLYNLEKDPGEMRNLADEPEFADVLADMKKRLAALMEKTKQ